MSLLTKWSEVRDGMLELTNKIDSVKGSNFEQNMSSPEYVRALYDKPNQWRCLKYNTRNGTNTPSLDNLITYGCAGVQYRSHDTSANWNWGDSYIGVRECYVYAKRDYDLSTSYFTDDAGRIYLNGSSIATNSSCETKSVTLKFKKGLNHVQILFNEGSGGDAGYLNTNLATQSWVEWMCACPKL